MLNQTDKKQPQDLTQTVTPSKTYTGTVSWFNDSKGYGFLTSPELLSPVFVHHTHSAGDGFKTLAEGQSVRFQAIENPKHGIDARHVEKASVQS